MKIGSSSNIDAIEICHVLIYKKSYFFQKSIFRKKENICSFLQHLIFSYITKCLKSASSIFWAKSVNKSMLFSSGNVSKMRTVYFMCCREWEGVETKKIIRPISNIYNIYMSFITSPVICKIWGSCWWHQQQNNSKTKKIDIRVCITLLPKKECVLLAFFGVQNFLLRFVAIKPFSLFMMCSPIFQGGERWQIFALNDFKYSSVSRIAFNFYSQQNKRTNSISTDLWILCVWPRIPCNPRNVLSSNWEYIPY